MNVSSMTIIDLQNLTGATESDTVMQACIDEADREVNAYLGPYSLGDNATGTCEAACSKLAHAAWLKRQKPEANVDDFRAAAKTIMDQYIASQKSLGYNLVHRVYKV